MLEGGFGNYSSQQSNVQPNSAYKQSQSDYAQHCFEEQVFLNQVYTRDPSLKLVFQQNLSEPSVFRTRHYFQSILNVDVNPSDGIDMTVLALSDNGACLNFGSEVWFKPTQQQAIGTWVGRIKTLSQVIDVTTPFYKVLCHPLFVLATEDIGQRQKASQEAIEAMAKILRIDSSHIANPEGDISLLIGPENAELLLREVYYINSKLVSKTAFTKDIMPSSSYLTNQLVIVDSIGGSQQEVSAGKPIC